MKKWAFERADKWYGHKLVKVFESEYFKYL